MKTSMISLMCSALHLSVSKYIIAVEELRDQRLWPNVVMPRISVSGPTNFRFAFSFFLTLFPLVSCPFFLTVHYPLLFIKCESSAERMG